MLNPKKLLIGYARDEDIKPLLELMGMVAKSHGTVVPEAIKVVESFMAAQISPAQRDYAIACFRTGRDQPATTASITKRAFHLYGFQNDDIMRWLEPLQVLEVLLRVAYADGAYTIDEDYIIDSVRGTLGVHKRSFWILRDTLAERLNIRISREGKSFSSASEDEEKKRKRNSNEDAAKIQKKISRAEAFRILEINENADKQEIKNSYRAMTKKYHPDLLHAANIPEEKMKESIKYFCMAQEAYEFLMQTKD